MKYLLLLTLGFTAAAAEFHGVITDSMCGLDHKHMNISPDSKCVLECRKMSDIKYVLADGKKMYKLSDQETPGKFAAQRVKITGTLYEKTGIIKVDRIEKE